MSKERNAIQCPGLVIGSENEYPSAVCKYLGKNIKKIGEDFQRHTDCPCKAISNSRCQVNPGYTYIKETQKTSGGDNTVVILQREVFPQYIKK